MFNIKKNRDMKKNKLLLAALLTSTILLSNLAVANSQSFQEFQLGFGGSVVNKQNPEFIISLNDRTAASNLVLDNTIRSYIARGVEYQPRNKNFNMPSNSNILSAINVLEDIYYETGLKLYVINSFNGLQNVLVLNPEKKDYSDIFTILSESKYIESVTYEEAYQKEQVISDISSREIKNDPEFSTMSVITPNFRTDPLYADQSVFARQTTSNVGVHSAESALRLMESAGVFNSGRRVNVAILDGGRIDHEDIEWAESVDFKHFSDSGIVYLNHGQAPDGGRMYEYHAASAGRCIDYLDENGDYLVDGGGYVFDYEFHSCAYYSSVAGYSEYPVNEFCFTSDDNNAFGSAYECNPDDFKEWDITEGYAVNSQHGLNVAGVIAAKSNNGIGIAGLIPHNNVNLTSALVVDGSGGGNISMGIYWAIGELNHHSIPASEYPADIINMSFRAIVGCTSGMNDRSAYMRAYEKGVVMVSGAGNDNFLTTDIVPASCAENLSVGAVTDRGHLTTFSNFGATTDVMALGQNVATLGVRVTGSHVGRVIDHDLENVYTLSSGTSFSAPITSGLAGLLKLINPDYTPDEIFSIIQKTATDMNTGYGGTQTTCSVMGCGAGSINFENAVRYALYNETVNQPVAKHFLADTAIAENNHTISQLAAFAEVCNKYQVKEGVIFSEAGKTTVNLYGQHEDTEFTLISSGNAYDFVFDDTHDNYRIEVCSAHSDTCSAITDLSIDRSYSPGLCN